MLTGETITFRHADQFHFVSGDLGASAADCRTPCDATACSLAFATDSTQLDTAVHNAAAILIIHRSLMAHAASLPEMRSCVFAVASIPMSMAILLQYFDRKPDRFTQWGARHPTAVVHESAIIGENVVLGPYCVIGAHARIGDDCLIGAHTVIEYLAQIGPANHPASARVRRIGVRDRPRLRDPSAHQHRQRRLRLLDAARRASNTRSRSSATW